MTTSELVALTTAIEQLKAAASQLPACDRAAKLAGLIRRLDWTLADGADVTATVTALAQATRQALDDDPWMELDRIAHRLRLKISAGDPTHSEDRASANPLHCDAGR